MAAEAAAADAPPLLLQWRAALRICVLRGSARARLAWPARGASPLMLSVGAPGMSYPLAICWRSVRSILLTGAMLAAAKVLAPSVGCAVILI